MSVSHLKKACCASVLLAFAIGAAPTLSQDAVTIAAEDFVAAEGFDILPIEHIEGALADMLGGDPEAMIPADAGISSIEKALLLIDTQEEPPVRVRYLLRYNQQTVDGVALSLVTVERYNLGPTIREEAIAAYGAENTAPPEDFGLGPHVRWRFAMQPTAKVSALLLAASRQEISDKAATRASCLIRTCLAPEPLDEYASWSEWVPHEAPLPVVDYPAVADTWYIPYNAEISPAFLAVQLAVAAGIAEHTQDGVIWNMPERQGGDTDTPTIALLIDRNLGQEITIDGALGVAKLGLDNEEHWTRLSGGVFANTITLNEASAEGQLQ